MESVVVPMQDFWKGKKVLVTGHTGFKGGWLVTWLKLLGANVTGYSLDPPTETNFFTIANVQQDMLDIRADVRDYQALYQAIDSHKPEILFHLAAQPLVRYSYENPVETYATNVMGTVNILEAVRKTNHVRTIVNITTDKCYENKEWLWGYRENEPLGGYDPYSNSKGCAELVTSAYRNSYFNPEQLAKHNVGLASARAGNVIGGGDWSQDRLLPDLINACMANKKVTIRYPNAIRPWQHVLEPVAGYLSLAQNLHQNPQQFAEAWNFGPYDQDAMPVAWIADEVIRLWGGVTSWENTEKQEAHEATYLKLDCSKAHTKLRWQPKWNIKQALKATVEWYQAHQDGANMHDFTLQQIAQYSQNK